ncbi:Heterokaryon incompatibility [Penicillium angulare]|uniref:Heterokaryon incompatibility n=1 Tax=Penicillium angulare TaxID=116970 RepID=UPI002540E61B|nr:Heterokaryon incompatibility [Penicillium angulare]KAJ5263840.1 Heterokaryon incompatibility [Penicillium angulare]
MARAIYGVGGRYYAIHLQYRRGQWFGVFLMVTGSGDSFQPEKMIKVENPPVLTLRGYDEYLPKRKEVNVNWIVL